MSSISDAIEKWKEDDENNRVEVIQKGMNNFTEMYSAIEAEVPVESDEQTKTNHNLIQKLKRYSKVIL